MGKKMKLYLYCFFILLLIQLFTQFSYSKDLFTKELKWGITSDSSRKLFFQDTNKIIESGKNQAPFAVVRSEKFYIKNHFFFILIVDICSGVSCPNIEIYEFKKF